MIKTFILMLLISINLSADMDTSNENPLTVVEIQYTEDGILSEALKNKDYAAISTIALSFYATSKNSDFKGDAKKLKKRAIELLLICHKNGHIDTSIFLISAYLKSNPTFSRTVAKEVINLHRNNKQIRYIPSYYNSVMLYVSSVLDNSFEDTKEVNFAIEALESLPNKNAQTNFYMAFLFKAINAYDIADSYLNEACHTSKVGSNIYKYCMNGKDIDKVDLVETKVINPDCKKDIGQRCK